MSLKVIFIVALKQELPAHFSEEVPIFTIKQCIAEQKVKFDSSIICIVTGVGKTAIERTMSYIHQHLSPLFVINFGTAGSSQYSTGTFVIPRTVTHKDMNYYLKRPIFPFELDQSYEIADTLTTVTEIDTAQSFELVDMEGYWFVHYAEQYKLPYYIIKCVSDSNNPAEFSNNISYIQEQFTLLFARLFTKHTSISVIIPTYNRADHVKRAVQSVLNQTVSCEIIVVDDGSTDHTLAVLRDFKEQIHVISHHNNKGVSAARNTGVDAAKSHWVSFLDSDDVWEPKKCEHDISYLNKNYFFHNHRRRRNHASFK